MCMLNVLGGMREPMPKTQSFELSDCLDLLDWTGRAILPIHGQTGLNHFDTWALDTGCLWGGQLTALHMDAPALPDSTALPGMSRPNGLRLKMNSPGGRLFFNNYFP